MSWAKTLAAVAVFALAACASLEVRTLQTLSQANLTVAAGEGIAHNLYLAGKIDKQTVRKVALWVDRADDWSLSARCAYAKHDLTKTASYMTAIVAAGQAIGAILHNETPPPASVVAISCANPAPLPNVAVPASLMGAK